MITVNHQQTYNMVIIYDAVQILKEFGALYERRSTDTICMDEMLINFCFETDLFVSLIKTTIRQRKYG